MDTGSFNMQIKTQDLHKDIVVDVGKRYDSSDYKSDIPLSKEMNKNVTGLIKDELRGKIIREIAALRPKKYSYLTDDDKNVKKAKGIKKV